MVKRKKALSLLSLILSFVFIISVFAAGCGKDDVDDKEEVKLTYTGSTLADGQVGVAYSASVATAEGADSITYALKNGATLPEGLTFGDGAISGTPSKAADAHKFTVVATAGDKSAEAEFTLTVKAANFAYADGEISVEVNKPAEASVATATGATEVTYAIKTGTLPAGLTLGANGAISGTPTATGTASVVITATAAGIGSADATWEIRVTNPKLVYGEVSVDAGLLGVYYTALVSTATGANNIKYAVAEGSAIPAGLTLEESGLLHGKPTERGRKVFSVTASAEGFEPTTAEVSLLIRPNETDPGSGTISFKGGKLDDGMENAKYVKLTGGVRVAVADNQNPVAYEIADGALPSGITMYENGALYGVPAERGNYTFTVKASAEGCEDKTAQFTLKITEPRVPLPAFVTLETAVVGTEYSVNLAPADAAMEITFSAKTALPAGFTLDSDGTLHGTPTASARAFSFTIEGSSSGYSSANCEVTISIRDKEVTLENGKMEAELVDLTGKIGAGYSGAANQEQMVQPGAALGASNNYYVGYTHCTLVLEFKFKSSAAASGVRIDIGLASELGDVTFTPKEMDVVLNGNPIAYGQFKIKGGASAGSWGNFASFTATRSGALIEGDNVIQIIIKPNTFLKGQSTGGPGIDYIQLTSSSTLSWTPCLYNTNGR